MSLRLGETAPNFQASTTAGDVDFYEYVIVVPAVSTEDAIKKFPKGIKDYKTLSALYTAAKS